MRFKGIIVEAFVCLTFCSCSSAPPSREQLPGTRNSVTEHALQREIDGILDDSLLAPCLTGVEILSLEGGKVLYERNGTKLFHPASNMKLLTTAAALNILANDFLFRTTVRADSPSHNGVLSGDLQVKGSGDPLLTTSHMDSLADLVRKSGIDTISGDLVGDVSYFDSLYWGAGWMWDDEPDADEAFITPLTVNANAVEVLVRPGRRIGDTTACLLEPRTGYVSIQNSGITSLDTLVPGLRVSRRRGENTIRIEGRIPPHSPEQHFLLSVWRPELYFLQLFAEKLVEHGVRIGGSLRLGTAAGKLQIAEVSHPIDSVIHRVNKQSDNIAAENLLKTLAAERSGQPGSAAGALVLVRSYLSGIGLDTAKMSLNDGSGVSWYNEIAPASVVELLRGIHEDRDRFERFYESLPVGGADGTLKNRLRGTSAAGNVRAKTGSLTGASALSGYVTSADGKLLAFSILCNHFPGQIGILRDVQDRIVDILARYNVSAQ